MTQPTLGRQVSALEKELGVILFERVGQGLVLTPSRMELLEHVRVMGKAANQVSLSASGRTQNIEGNVCISASEVYTAYVLPGIIAKLGQPSCVSDMEKLDFIGFDDTATFANLVREFGLNLSKQHFPLITQSHFTQWELVKRGLGVGIMAEAVGEKEPIVRQVLPEFPAIIFPIWLTTHRELRSSRRVKLVFDLLAHELQSESAGRVAI